jgi:curved DNA-binding protein CbpA/GGDEF domain-containing protein
LAFTDHYCVLQVHPEAEQEIIQSAYKRLCKKYHPDVNSDPASALHMQQINNAYEILGDPIKRRTYHVEWKLRNTPRPTILPPPVADPLPVRERIIYVRPEPIRYGGGTQGAYQVVVDYFNHLAKANHRDAFSLISAMDREHFNYGSFAEWQGSVSALYEIGSVSARLFKRHPKFKTDNDVHVAAEEYAVTITEKTIASGNVNEYTVNKYAIAENGIWKIYLGYRDLTPLMLQFRTVANKEEAQFISVWEKYRDSTNMATGLPNRSGFETRLEEESYRNRRYNRPFCVVTFRIEIHERTNEADQFQRLIRYAGYIISSSLRPIDFLAYFGDGYFGALLSETAGDYCQNVIDRILSAVRHDIAACFDFELGIRASWTEATTRAPGEIVEQCLRSLHSPSDFPRSSYRAQ